MLELEREERSPMSGAEREQIDDWSRSIGATRSLFLPESDWLMGRFGHWLTGRRRGHFRGGKRRPASSARLIHFIHRIKPSFRFHFTELYRVLPSFSELDCDANRVVCFASAAVAIVPSRRSLIENEWPIGFNRFGEADGFLFFTTKK